MQFYKAVSSANLEEVRRLVAEKNLSGILEKDEEKQTLLHTIVNKSSKYYESSREILKILLKLKKIDVNAQDYRGLTALHCAAARGRIEMCLELLQQRGIKIDAVNNDENNALIFLCQTKYNKNNEVIFTIVLKLVLAEVDIDYKNKDGETALHFASLVGNTQAVNFLCSNNCNVDALNNKFETPLVYAVRNLQTETVKLLLEQGADTSITTLDGINIQNMITTEDIHLLIRGFRPKDFVFKSKMKELAEVNDKILDQLNELDELKLKKTDSTPKRERPRGIPKQNVATIKRTFGAKKYFKIHFDNLQVCEKLHYQFYLVRSGGWQCVMKRIEGTDNFATRNLSTELTYVYEEVVGHPSFLSYHHHDTIDNYIRIFTNLPSISLEDFIRQKRDKEIDLQPEEIQKIATEIAIGIEHLHSKDLVHRNLKTSSIYLIYTEKGEIERVNMNFYYIAKRDAPWYVSDRNPEYFEPIYYFPDESRKGSSSDFRFQYDIWAFGIVLFELLTLMPPYRECPTNDHILQVMKTSRPLIPISILNKNGSNPNLSISPRLSGSSGNLSNSGGNNSSSGSLGSSSGRKNDSFLARYQNLFDLFEACTQIDPTQRPSIDQIVKALVEDVNIKELRGYRLQQDNNQMQAISEWNSKNFSLSKCFLPTIKDSSLFRQCNGWVIESPLPENMNNPSFVQFYEENIPYYQLGLYPKPHDNFKAISAEGHSLIVSVETDGTFDENANCFSYRVIIRSIAEDYRFTFTCDNPKDRLKAFRLSNASLENAKLFEVVKEPGMATALLELERNLLESTNYKFGVIYRKPGQIYDDEMYSNLDGSPAYHEFLSMIGEKIALNGWNKFRGGLDVISDSTGSHTIYNTLHNFEIIFHISTYLPIEDNPQQIRRKSHLGNDVVIIVFQDDNADQFTPANFKSNFNHCFIVVQPVYTPDNIGPPGRSGVDHFRFGVSFKDSVQYRPRPFLQDPCVLLKDKDSIDRFLTKLINCQRVSMKSEEFQRRLQYIRTNLFNEVFNKFDSPANKIGTIRKMGKSILNFNNNNN